MDQKICTAGIHAIIVLSIFAASFLRESGDISKLYIF